ncbi:hypothetical protein K2Z83_25360 [Oscillochloris sp. ZM17-4]|uniref:protein DpdD n=1 Tax=Oscillochloris sp. ZM17-4 TaxID=2866714 RepID=UPI001C7337C3|nr:protein DpdD [Oscillochloris sp. ZM17-4]MBX0330987.1 hypothetical protein [Oscillochloris sp. ZM17-4]
MRTVVFNDQARFDLAATLAAALGTVADPAELTIAASESLAALIERLAQGEPTILPVREEGSDTWLVMGAVRRDLEAALSTIGHFVIPTYAEHAGGAPSHRAFDPAAGEVGRLGAMVYPAGHYLLRSPARHFERMLDRLGRWAALEQRRPQLQVAHSPSYRELYDSFSAALSAGAWDAAAATLAELRRRGLASADNLAFLDVQLLAQQRRWDELWRREDYGDIARLRAPRAAREALLAAFHQSELLPLEQAGRWGDALDTFRRLRIRLGGLLEGVADTAYGPVLRVFAYREAAAGDRVALAQLAERAADEETRLVIEALLALLPEEPLTLGAAPEVPVLTPEQALRSALMEGRYDEAWHIAEQLDTAEARTQGMLEAAFFGEDTTQAEEALLQLWSLPQEQQDALLATRRYAQIVRALSDSVSPPVPAAPDEPPISDWLVWLSVAAADPDDRRLPQALAAVAAADDRYWTDDRVAELAGRLTDLAAGGAALSRPHLRDAIRQLRDHFLQDSLFPRKDTAHADVYEALYAATLDQREVNILTTLALLRLAEARLRRSPSTITTAVAHLTGWLDSPAPALGDAALETLDLLAAYGAQGPALGPWLRAWAESVLGAPRPPDRVTLEGWLAFATWAHPGADLLDDLRARLAAPEDDEDDPIAQLPVGYSIGIFTLRPQSAARAGELIRRRNPGVQIRLCEDTVLTDQARALAQNADMCVVVTTCLTHALTYGIGPYLRDPVYPQSSGATSIARAIIERAGALAMAQ